MTKGWLALVLALSGLLLSGLVAVWVWIVRNDPVLLLDRATIGGFVLAEVGTILTTVGLVLGTQVYLQRRSVHAVASFGGEARAAAGSIGKKQESQIAGDTPSSPQSGSIQVRSIARGRGSQARAAGGDIAG